MPQSTPARQALMEKWFGDPISDEGPTRFLVSRNYVLLPSWEWQPPVPFHTPTWEEMQCYIFLIEEWDFGGLARPKEWYNES